MNRSSVFWAHRYAWNVAKIKYDHAMQEIRSTQASLEAAGVALVASLDAEALELSPVLMRSLVNRRLESHAAQVLERCWGLADIIIGKFADGWLINGEDDLAALGYPNWWLKGVGFARGRKDRPALSLGSSELCVRACPSGPEFDACLGRCTPGPTALATNLDAQREPQTDFGWDTVLACGLLALVTGALMSHRMLSASHARDAARQSLLYGSD